MATITQDFQSAPMGRRVLVPTLLSLSIVLGLFLFDFVMSIGSMHRARTEDRVAVAVAPLVGVVVLGALFLKDYPKVQRFRIEENILVLDSKRFPLQGVTEVGRDPNVMKWAIKTGLANAGIGAIRGTFRSRRLGKFYAFMTGTEKAVVLRWADRVVAVSPDDPEFFILSVRSAAGLR